MYYPKISIIIPNFNYVNYIEKTILSVINQNYPNLELIIIDGGSTDGSIEIIKKYETYIAYWVSEKDKGQTNAINKGLLKSSGEIIGWLNSDDTYCENTLNTVAEYFIRYPKIDIVFGDMNFMDLNDNFIYRRRHIRFSFLEGCFLSFSRTLSSASIFWRRRAMETNGYLNDSLKCNMDGEYFSRLTINMKVKRIPHALANFRQQPFTKAAEKESNWRKIVDSELAFELENSYQRLWLSKILPYKKSGFIKFLFSLRRIILRGLHGHYIFKFIEIRKYKKKHHKNQ
jgi:glycosyltransferase involved in cell wall biosynthesis